MKGNITENERLYLFCHYAVRHNAALFRGLCEKVGSLEELFAIASHRDAKALLDVKETVIARLFEAAAPGFMDTYCEKLLKAGISIAIPGEEDYPAILSEIQQPPALLFYKGILKKEYRLPIGVVGSRRCTKYGRDIARLFSYDLAKHGATVISGMAAGIDSEAALGALDAVDAELPTVAVLGTGVDVIYPRQNDKLYERIIERGAVVSEFLPGDEPRPEHFPIRNRVISGMSKGLLVVEAGERSGSSITAGLALDQGRDVFAVPGRITDAMSIGTNRLIQQGAAKPVFCPQDILCEYSMAEGEEPSVSIIFAADTAELDDTERRICDALRDGEKDPDELCMVLGLEPVICNCTLTALEFSGLIKPLPGRRYALEPVKHGK